jgi:hypothetical protein
MSMGTVYALAAAKEALEDADWHPSTDAEKEDTGKEGPCINIVFHNPNNGQNRNGLKMFVKNQ